MIERLGSRGDDRGIGRSRALPDMDRLRAERLAKIQDQLEAQDIDGLVLLGLGRRGPRHRRRRPGRGRRAGRPLPGRRRRGHAATSAPHLYTPSSTGCRRSSRPTMCTGLSSPTSTTGSHEFVEALNGSLPRRCPPRRRRADPPDAARAGPVRMERRRARVLGAAKILKTPDEVSAIREAQRITEQAMDTRPRGPAARAAPDRAERHLPPPHLRAGRHGQRHRPHLAGHDPDQGGRARGPPTATWPTRLRRPTGSCARATSSGSTPASATRATPRTSAAPGSRAPHPALTERQTSHFARWRSRRRRRPRHPQAGRVRPRARPGRHRRQRRRQALDGALLPGPRHRHRQRRDAADRDRSGRGLRRVADHGPGHGPRLRAGHLGRGIRRLPLRGHRGRHRHRLGPAQRPALRPLRGGAFEVAA